MLVVHHWTTGIKVIIWVFAVFGSGGLCLCCRKFCRERNNERYNNEETSFSHDEGHVNIIMQEEEEAEK